MPVVDLDRNDQVMFSESAGRFVVTVDPQNRAAFESLFKTAACACIGTVTETPQLEIEGLNQETIVSLAVKDLKAAWKKPFGDLI